MTRLARLSLAQPTANDASVNYRMYVVLQSPQISHRPDGNIADVLGSTLACTTVNASVNYSLYVPQ